MLNEFQVENKSGYCLL